MIHLFIYFWQGEVLLPVGGICSFKKVFLDLAANDQNMISVYYFLKFSPN